MTAPTPITVSFVANQSWFMVLDLSRWAALYDFTQGALRMHLRTSPGSPTIVYGFSTQPAADNVGGTITFDPTTNFLYGVAPYADMLRLAAAYAPFSGFCDIQYTSTLLLAPGVPLIQDIAAGPVTVTSGVTVS